MLAETKVKSLANEIQGRVACPGDPEYDTARTIWNAMIDKRPALIARCVSPSDVSAAVGFAREHELLVSIRGGGHNVAGNALCDDGLMIDLSLMKDVQVDAKTHTVTAQAGCTLGDMDRATDSYGLAVPSGIVSETGIGGLTLGGGVGWLVRKFGLTCDNLISAEVVTADGNQMTANAEENDDLYWGLRGGGGNFGVVTSFQYRAHEVSHVLGGMVIHPSSAARDVFNFYRDFSTNAPDELTTYSAFLTLPDGAPAFVVIVCYCGDPVAGEKVLEPLRNFGSPLDDTISHIPRLAMQTMFDEAFPYGNHNYWKSAFIDELTDDAIGTLIEHANRIASPQSALMCEYYHSPQSSRIDDDATAFSHRGHQYDIGIIGQWTDPKENDKHMTWAREAYDAMQPYANGRIYANMMGGDQMTEVEQLRATFGINYERLAALKQKYDPTNFFRLNQNIKPSG